jgi:beta-mannosidase
MGASRPPLDFDEAVYLTQWMQAEALTTGIDAWRANKPETMGTIIWHLNDCWPGITWSLIDYEKRPKLAYWAVRQAFAPTSLILIPSEIGLRAVAVNDGSPRDQEQRLTFRIKSYELDGRLLDWKDQEVVLPAGGKLELGVFTLRALGIQTPAKSVVVGELIDGRSVVAARMYAPIEPKHVVFPEPLVSCSLDCIVAGTRAIFVLRSENIVRGVEFDVGGAGGARVRFENSFDLWPQREVWVQVDLPGTVSPEELCAAARFRCLNDLSEGRRIAWRPLHVGQGEGRARDASQESPQFLVRMKSTDMIPKL